MAKLSDYCSSQRNVMDGLGTPFVKLERCTGDRLTLSLTQAFAD